jgi:hypothetical protein
MLTEGFPDRERHRICYRCRKWHEPDEGKLVYPEASGPFSSLRRMAEVLADDESKMRFICFRCIKIRRYTKWVLFGSLAILVVVILLLEKVDILD